MIVWACDEELLAIGGNASAAATQKTTALDTKKPFSAHRTNARRVLAET
jgi:hypothetical protein